MVINPATKVETSFENTRLIRGIDVPVRIQQIEQDKLRFYPDNPRIYSIVRENGNVPTQNEIQLRLLEMEHVKSLVQDIRLNKGLLEPLIVKDGTFEVLEGNSRLAAYRFLAKSDPLKWGYVKCEVLPRDIAESLIFALLGQLHIKGKKDWAPYEQAGFLYRRYKHHKADFNALAMEIGISKKKVKHLVDTYEFMVDNDENDVNRWSYYDEYLKSNKIKRARTSRPELDTLVVEKIRNGEIERAVDLRQQLPVICSSPKILDKFVNETVDFADAFDAAVKAGGDNSDLKTIKKFKDWITRPRVEAHLREHDGKIRGGIVFELRKIESRVRNLLKKLED